MRGTSNFDEGRVEAIAVSLEEQLSIVYPRGPDSFSRGDKNCHEKESADDESKEDLVLRTSLFDMGCQLSFPDDSNELKAAFSQAVQRWKSKSLQNCNTNSISEEATAAGENPPGENSAKDSGSTVNSFSLLDQLQGGFALPVSLDEIREASSTPERLKVFQKIKYLEDLIMDWKEICPILKKDLIESAVRCPQLALDSIALHRKWFHQGRSSSEYTPLLYGICQNLLETLAKTVQSEHLCETQDRGDTHDEYCLVASLVQNWRDMWLDMMQRDQYSKVLAEDTEKCMFSLFLRNDPSNKWFYLTRKVLACVDPGARWFHSWTYHVQTNDHLILLLCNPEHEKTVLSDLWIQMNNVFSDVPSFDSDKASVSFLSTAVVSIILSRTRLSRFPWEGLAQSITLEDKATPALWNANLDNFRATIDKMLDLFLRAVVFLSLGDQKTSSDSNDAWKTTILDGVEAILAGSNGNDSNSNNSDFARRYSMVTSTLRDKDADGDKAVTRFLQSQLNQ
eukprot:jgi/Psemu1/23335/gm1.23335_g